MVDFGVFVRPETRQELDQAIGLAKTDSKCLDREEMMSYVGQNAEDFLRVVRVGLSRDTLIIEKASPFEDTRPAFEDATLPVNVIMQREHEFRVG